MRSVMIIAAVLVGGGTVMANMADKISATPPTVSKSTVNVASLQAAPSQAGGRSVTIPRDSRGHFQTDARIDGQRIGVMIDTGASMLALNETSAARIGVRPSRADFKARVSTANGSVKGARLTIPMVDVGGLIVRDVEAMVLPDEALSENLLGLSFLSKLKRFEYASGQMLLEQ